jgi:hypothetical protein
MPLHLLWKFFTKPFTKDNIPHVIFIVNSTFDGPKTAVIQSMFADLREKYQYRRFIDHLSSCKNLEQREQEINPSLDFYKNIIAAMNQRELLIYYKQDVSALPNITLKRYESLTGTDDVITNYHTYSYIQTFLLTLKYYNINYSGSALPVSIAQQSSFAELAQHTSNIYLQSEEPLLGTVNKKLANAMQEIISKAPGVAPRFCFLQLESCKDKSANTETTVEGTLPELETNKVQVTFPPTNLRSDILNIIGQRHQYLLKHPQSVYLHKSSNDQGLSCRPRG